MVKTIVGYAATAAEAPLARFSFNRRDLEPEDVEIEILFCGICHTDLHYAKNEWKNTVYPVVPGHEIVGKVIRVGDKVKSFKIGDFAAVGCIVDSCHKCSSCQKGEEQYCDEIFTMTYNSPDKRDGKPTYGGYSTHILVNEKYVLHVPKSFKEADLPGVAPLLCAGITTYSPLHHWKVGKGSKVGIVGLGGLGHMGLKIAHALGAHVVLFTTSANKVEDAKRLGADEVIVWKKPDELKKHTNTFDFILDTVAVPHNLDPFIETLRRDGTMCLVGLPGSPHPSPAIANFISKRRSLAGSMIGGIKETQEMLDFCAEHHITSDIEVIPIQKVNEAFERMLKSDVKYRFVIDIASLKKE